MYALKKRKKKVEREWVWSNNKHHAYQIAMRANKGKEKNTRDQGDNSTLPIHPQGGVLLQMKDPQQGSGGAAPSKGPQAADRSKRAI